MSQRSPKRFFAGRTVAFTVAFGWGCLLTPAAWAQADGATEPLQQQIARLSNQQSASTGPSASPVSSGRSTANLLPTMSVSKPPSVGAPPTSANGGAASVGQTIGQDAFAATLRSMMPMTPDQIRTLRLAYDAAHKAAVYGYGAPPKPVATSRAVDLSPGATPPVIRLAAGYITSLVLVDATGAPWPIKAFDLGNPTAYDIQWDNKGGNALMIQALKGFRPANLAVMLKGFDTPIMITLMPAQQMVDYRVDMRIPHMGPNAQQQLLQLPQAADPMLLNVLDGIKPVGSTALAVTGGRAQAWLSRNQVYMRTPLTVISPGWTSMMSSADGTHVYLLPKASMVLAIDRGKMVQLLLKGF